MCARVSHSGRCSAHQLDAAAWDARWKADKAKLAEAA
jgi:hypothetical protein